MPLIAKYHSGLMLSKDIGEITNSRFLLKMSNENTASNKS